MRWWDPLNRKRSTTVAATQISSMRARIYPPIPSLTSNNCGSKLISIEPTEISKVIDDKWLPLIELSADSSFILIPVNVDENPKFIALSHVWSHGLGNPIVERAPVNGISQCQLKRLRAFLNKLEPDAPVRFWIDTLCMPAPHSFSNQRNAAINTMNAIYTNATKVLVLDAELIQTCIHISPIEQLMRVFTSTWMRRVWTLQEGIVNENVFIQFRDGVMSPREVTTWSQHEQFRHRGDRNFLIQEVAEPWSHTRYCVKLPQPKNLAAIIKYLYFRKMTDPADETICLGLLTGADSLVQRSSALEVQGFASFVSLYGSQCGWSGSGDLFLHEFKVGIAIIVLRLVFSTEGILECLPKGYQVLREGSTGQ